MSRPKIGIALGSGGARGLAHIGILKVLEENNIPIDFIAGVSIGSIIGAYYALNKEIGSLNEKVTQLTKKDFIKLIDITSPKKALISGNKIKRFLKELVDNNSFSDLQIPLIIIATDMSTGKEVLIQKGKLGDAIRASISIPGIFPLSFKWISLGTIRRSPHIIFMRSSTTCLLFGSSTRLAR